MSKILRSLPAGLCAALLLLATLAAAVADDVSAQPANLGGGLRELAAWHAANAKTLAPALRTAAVQAHLQSDGKRVQSDAAGRVVVNVYLDGKVPEATLRTALAGVGADVFSAVPAGQSVAAGQGMLGVWLPVAQAATVAGWAGVRSVILVHRPWRHVGLKTSQGVAAMRVTAVLARHFTGKGMTIGVISDSYDVTSPHADASILVDDLPGPGNRAHRTTPVNVVQDDDPTDSSATDEGRAMLQIVHDVAPDSALAFCTVGYDQAAFATAITSLRTQANCDVIVDDIGFPDEPIFSDGVVSQAVENVVNSTTLAGKKALYYSAAGNDGSLGYEADFSAVSDTNARNGNAGTNNLDLSTVPTTLTAGGFHNFTAGAGTTIVQQFIVSAATAEIDFQWNDPFSTSGMTSDFNVLVFDADGNYKPHRSGTDNNFTTGQAVEIVDLDPNVDGSDATYQIAITRTAQGTHTAQHFRYTTDTNGDIGGSLLAFKVPSIVGHPGSRSADGVAAYAYNHLKEPEDFSSFGPVTNYFNAQGQRLAQPEVRQQPTVAAPDGVVTTMVNFAPFFGTSAAAPHAAAVAALCLEAAGGPGSLTPAQVRTALQATAPSHDLDPLVTTAKSVTPTGTVTLTAEGDSSDFSSTSDHFFTLSFTGPAGSMLSRVLIDLTASGLKFDPDPTLGFPFTVSSATGGASATVTSLLASSNRRLLLTFTAFPVGGSIRFGIDRDVAAYSAGGNAAEQLLKGVVTAYILPPGATKVVLQKATFVDQLGKGWSPADGFGFINADAAVKSVTP